MVIVRGFFSVASVARRSNAERAEPVAQRSLCNAAVFPCPHSQRPQGRTTDPALQICRVYAERSEESPHFAHRQSNAGILRSLRSLRMTFLFGCGRRAALRDVRQRRLHSLFSPC
jgi:hypothetical protein